ncbi:DUF6706 family protein [Flavicella sediminum]|uniref:DUF6706 family protein n=1 Tax=Flavicella sediminum TaxID=2585141 RepID=UPI0011211A82|nr:DUF6706 family protein [Flavicella sediminum]
MTNKDVILAKALFQSFPSVTVDKALIDRSLNGADNYVSSSLKQIELVTADLYVEAMTSPDFQEGSLSVTYPRELLKDLAIKIYTKHGDDKLYDLKDTQGSIESVSPW